MVDAMTLIIAAFDRPNASVMAGRDIFVAERQRTSQQCPKLEIAVACQARVRRQAACILIQEVFDHMLPELFLVVKYIVGNAKLGTHASGALSYLLRTA